MILEKIENLVDFLFNWVDELGERKKSNPEKYFYTRYKPVEETLPPLHTFKLPFVKIWVVFGVYKKELQLPSKSDLMYGTKRSVVEKDKATVKGFTLNLMFKRYAPFILIEE